MIRLTREKKKTILGFMLIGVIMLQGKRAYIILPLFVQKTSTVLSYAMVFTYILTIYSQIGPTCIY